MLQRIDFGLLARRVLATGYTTASLGRAIGLSQPSVWRLANGKTGTVSADVAMQLIQLAGGRVEIPELPPQS
jgi:transcriptional regulator with XRE-family HTH domain